MSKLPSLVELNPESAAKPTRAKPRKSPRASTRALAQVSAQELPSSQVKPLLIGMGAGAALAVTVLVVRSQTERRVAGNGRGPSLTRTLVTSALFGLARIVAERAVSTLAKKATQQFDDVARKLGVRDAALKLSDAWHT